MNKRVYIICKNLIIMIFKSLYFVKHNFILGLSSTLLGFFFSGCALNDRMSTFDYKGPVAKIQYDLFMVTVYVCLILFIIVAAALAWAVVKYRARKGDENKPMPKQGHGNPLVEVGLIGGSILMLVVIAVPTVNAIWYTHQMPKDDQSSHLISWYPNTQDIPSGEEDSVLIIRATGYQWWWTFEYPQFGIRTANEMVIPKGKTVRIELRAADVIHSFWFPKFAGKVDLIPGRNNWMWIQADHEGHYYGQCAEFCGEAHAYMLIRSDVVNEMDFANWVQHQTTPAPLPKERSLASEGKKLFVTKTCVQCHRVDGHGYESLVGPDLSHIASRKSIGAGILENIRDDLPTKDYSGSSKFASAEHMIDPEKLRKNLFEWVRYSQKYKPGNLMYYPANGLRNLDERGDFTDEDVHKIVDYLMTLK